MWLVQGVQKQDLKCEMKRARESVIWEDPVLKEFDSKKVDEVRHLIEFLYNRQGLLSPVVDTRRRELASIINKDCSEYINAFERLEMLEQGDRHGDSRGMAS